MFLHFPSGFALCSAAIGFLPRSFFLSPSSSLQPPALFCLAKISRLQRSSARRLGPFLIAHRIFRGKVGQLFAADGISG
jgi:hypothetical protein